MIRKLIVKTSHEEIFTVSHTESHERLHQLLKRIAQSFILNKDLSNAVKRNNFQQIFHQQSAPLLAQPKPTISNLTSRISEDSFG